MFTTSIANIRRTAFQLASKGSVTSVRLADALQCTCAEIETYVEGYTGLREELEIVPERTFHALKYALAADCILQRGEHVTRKSLAEELCLSVYTVKAWMQVNPESRDMLRVERAKKYMEKKPCRISTRAKQLSKVQHMRARAHELRGQAFCKTYPVPPENVGPPVRMHVIERREQRLKKINLLNRTRHCVALGA